jgi:hypothetical protein
VTLRPRCTAGDDVVGKQAPSVDIRGRDVNGV